MIGSQSSLVVGQTERRNGGGGGGKLVVVAAGLSIKLRLIRRVNRTLRLHHSTIANCRSHVCL